MMKSLDLDQWLSQRAMYVIGAITILAALVRLYELGSPLWYDEIAARVRSIDGSLGEIISSYESNNDHPFYSLLAKISIMLFGDTAAALRLPAALFGIATTPMIYVFARRHVTEKEAVLTAIIVALAYHMVWFSQNARGYTMILFFAISATWALHRAVTEEHKRVTYYALFAASLAAAAYTHLTMVLFGVAQAACVLGFVLLSQPRSDWFKALIPAALAFAGAGAITVLAYAPMMPDLIAFYMADATASQPSNSAKVANPVWAALAAFTESSKAFGGIIPVLLALILMAIGGLNVLFRKPFLACLIAIPVPVIALLSILLGRPIFPRFFFFLAAFMVLAAVHGAWLALQARERAVQLFGAAAGIITVWLTFILPQAYAVPKQDYVEAANIIDDVADGRDTYFISITSRLPFNAYLGREFKEITTAEDFDAAAAQSGPFLLVYTFEKYIESGLPEIWSWIEANCDIEASVPASVSGGDIRILNCSHASVD